jgi:hypothetical protein
MESPVRFRRGLHIKPAGQAGQAAAWKRTRASSASSATRQGLPTPGAPTRPATTAVASRAMAEVDPDQEAALRRLRAAFGFVEILRIVDHDQGQDQDDDELLEDREE